MLNPQLFALLLGSVAAAVSAAEDCHSLDARFQAQVQKQTLDAANITLYTMQAVCPQSIYAADERYLTDVLAIKAKELTEKGQFDAAKTLLEKAKTNSWALSEMRGYLASHQPKPDWGEVARHYGYALEQITASDNPAQLNKAELKTQSERLLKLASAAQLLYGKPAPAPPDGQLHGVLLAAQRGNAPQKIAYPVFFETNRADLTEDGKLSADELLKYINTQNPASITLTGHADERGSPHHNQELSERRAQTIADYLQQQGITASIHAIGQGEETVPPDIPFDNIETQWRLSRRVEMNLIR